MIETYNQEGGEDPIARVVVPKDFSITRHHLEKYGYLRTAVDAERLVEDEGQKELIIQKRAESAFANFSRSRVMLNLSIGQRREEMSM